MVGNSTERGIGVGVGVFVVRNGRFLMGRRLGAHGAGSWSLPGGHVEFGETFEQAARREVAEEVGVTLGDVSFGAVTNDLYPAEGLQYVSIWLVGEYRSGEPRVIESDKLCDLAWFGLDDLPQPLFRPWENLLVSAFLEPLRTRLSDRRRWPYVAGANGDVNAE